MTQPERSNTMGPAREYRVEVGGIYEVIEQGRDRGYIDTGQASVSIVALDSNRVVLKSSAEKADVGVVIGHAIDLDLRVLP